MDLDREIAEAVGRGEPMVLARALDVDGSAPARVRSPAGLKLGGRSPDQVWNAPLGVLAA